MNRLAYISGSFARPMYEFKWTVYTTSIDNGSSKHSSGNWIENGKYRWEVDAMRDSGSFHVRVYEMSGGLYKGIDQYWFSDHDEALVWCEREANEKR